MAARLASKLWRGHQNRQRNCHTETTFIHAGDLSAEISLFEFLKRLPELLLSQGQRRISIKSTHALLMDATKEKTQPGISQYIPLGWLRISAIPATQNESVAPWDNMNRDTSHCQGCFLRSSPTARITVMSHSKPPTAKNSIPSDLSDWFGAKPKVQTKRTPINKARASAARPGTPGYSRILLRLIETATKIRPASVAAAPVSALRKLDQPAVTFKLGSSPVCGDSDDNCAAVICND